MPVVEPVAGPGPRPFWSVMIPCYNGAEVLAETLESVLAQDPGPEAMEIEVVDDHSTLDDPAAVVADLGRGRVGFHRQPHNVGASANFTTCARRSRGDWVHILHGDDRVLPGFYDRYRERIEACPEAVMVGSQTVMTDARGRPVAVTGPVDTDGGYVREGAFTVAALHPLRCVAVVVARRAYEEVGGFHPGLAHVNDWEMWTRLAGFGPVAWVDESLGLYRDHPGSDSSRLHRSTAYLDDCLAGIEVIAGHFEDPERRHRVQLATRRLVGDYALGVGQEMILQGEFRLALANAARAVRIDPSLHSWSRAAEVAGSAVAGRLGPVRDRRAQRLRREA